jgi:predicted AAA+ superfamily ATPase
MLGHSYWEWISFTEIHGIKTLPRLVGAALSERLRVMPAVVVTGARQTGKSTFTLGASLLRVRRCDRNRFASLKRLVANRESSRQSQFSPYALKVVEALLAR